MSNFLNVIKSHKPTDKKTVSVWDVEFEIHPLTFGETLTMSKSLSAEGNEAEQSLLLIAAMVTDTDGDYLFKTDEGKDVLKNKLLPDVKVLLDACLEVAQFDTDKQVENKVKN